MRTRLIVSLLACVAIAGCGSSSNSSKSTSTAAPAPASTPSSSSSGGATVKVAGFAFNPTSVTVKKGQKVTWTNSDTAPHNVTSDDGTIQSKDFGQGQSFSFTPSQAGTFAYTCTIHPQMKATLIVTG